MIFGAKGADQPHIYMASSLDGLEAELLAEAGLTAPLAIVCDDQTVSVLGLKVARATGGALVVLKAPHADLKTAQALAHECRRAAGIVAVGSGTLTDLVKWAAQSCGVPCAVFATAPSMNGWLTATASLAVDGIKRSLPVTPPRGAFFALEILRQAPLRLLRAGLGDALCRPVVEADLCLASRLGAGERDATWFASLRATERALRAQAQAVLARDLAAVRLLTELLIAQSLLMRQVGSSAPASQGEHAIAHLLECFARPRVDAFHGELVALATVAMVRLQAHVSSLPFPPTLEPLAIGADELALVYGPTTPEAMRTIIELGLADPARVQALNERLSARWSELRRELAPLVQEALRLPPLYAELGLPLRPQQLAIDPAFFARALAVAFALRPRFGFLTLAALARIQTETLLARRPTSLPAALRSRCPPSG